MEYLAANGSTKRKSTEKGTDRPNKPLNHRQADENHAPETHRVTMEERLADRHDPTPTGRQQKFNIFNTPKKIKAQPRQDGRRRRPLTTCRWKPCAEHRLARQQKIKK